MDKFLILSRHAKWRSAQRNLSIDDMKFIIMHGKRVRKQGVIFYQLLAKKIPTDLPANHHFRRLVGSTVLTCQCGHFVITVYRNEKAQRRDRHKEKYRVGEQHQCCPYCE